MKTLLLCLLLAFSFEASAATKYYDDYPNIANPPGSFIISLQTGDKSVGGTPYNYWTLNQMVAWLAINGFTNSTVIISNVFTTNITAITVNATTNINQFTFTTNLYSTSITVISNANFNSTFQTNLTVIAPGGATNLNLNPLEVMWVGVNHNESTIPDGVGVLFDAGSGAVGYSNTVPVFEVDASFAFLTNAFFGFTNKVMATDSNGQATNLVIDSTLTLSANTLSVTPGGSPSLNGINITNIGFSLNTNNPGGAALVFSGPGKAATIYDTNITANTTLKLFDISACTATGGSFKIRGTCSGGTDRTMTFPPGCTGAGYGTPPVLTFTNGTGKIALIDVLYVPGPVPLTNVFWSPVY